MTQEELTHRSEITRLKTLLRGVLAMAVQYKALSPRDAWVVDAHSALKNGTPSMDEACSHPARSGRHEEYIGKDHRHCRACGAVADLRKPLSQEQHAFVEIYGSDGTVCGRCSRRRSDAVHLKPLPRRKEGG